MKVAWISDYPIEWMEDVPETLRGLPRQHPATWLPVLLGEFAKNPDLQLHVLVLRSNVQTDFEFQRNGVTFHVLKVPAKMRSTTLFWVDTVAVRRCLKRVQPDLVHAWGMEKGAGLVATRLGYPYLITIQGLLNWYAEVLPFAAYDRFAAAVERVCLRRARMATTESAFAVTYLRPRYPHLAVRQAEHAPNLHFHRLERRPQIAPIRFIAVGTFAYRKGSDLLLRALDQLIPEFPFELLVIGHADGKMINTLRRELSAELWKRVQFKPSLLPTQVAAELAAATILTMPTRADTSPNAVKEAVVAGVPVVATRIGGIVDYVEEGRNGLLVDADDLPGLVSALRDASRHPLFGQGRVDPETLGRMRDYLSPERMARNFFESYRAVLGQKPVQPSTRSAETTRQDG